MSNKLNRALLIKFNNFSRAFDAILFTLSIVLSFIVVIIFLNYRINVVPNDRNWFSPELPNILEMSSPYKFDSYIIAVNPPAVEKERIKFKSQPENQHNTFTYPKYCMSGNTSGLFNSSLFVTRIVPAGVFVICIILIIFHVVIHCIGIHMNSKHPGLMYDDSCTTNILNGSLVILVLCLLSSGYLAHLGNNVYQTGLNIYSQAVEAIPLNINKEEFKDSELKVKFDLVNSYLSKAIEYNEPMMYDIRQAKFIPFDYDKLRNVTVVDSAYDKMKLNKNVVEEAYDNSKSGENK